MFHVFIGKTKSGDLSSTAKSMSLFGKIKALYARLYQNLTPQFCKKSDSNGQKDLRKVFLTYFEAICARNLCKNIATTDQSYHARTP